jgi:hypothetical protein
MRSGTPLTILPCVASPALCTEHSIGRNLPDEAQATTERAKDFAFRIWSNLPFRLRATKASQCQILALPVELLQEFVTYLSASERVLFTLTCKALYSALGSQIFSVLRKVDKTELNKFLVVLQRDLPGYRFCQPCATLHSPKSSTIILPSNKLRREEFHPSLQAWLFAPGPPDILYWLSTEHLQRAISSQTCIHTLRCSGVVDLSEALPQVPALHKTTFSFKISPVVSRRNVIFHAVYQIQFPCIPARHWSKVSVRDLLAHFDIRCCLHCSTNQMLDEMICFLYHSRHPSQIGEVNGCVRARDWDADEGCNHHLHVCTCTTEYKIEPIGPPASNAVIGLKVCIWQWLGERKDDYVLKQRGVLRNAYMDAMMGLE